MAGDANGADLRTDALDSLEHAIQLAPSKPVVADVIHAVALVSKVERNLPGRAVGMEQKRPYIGTERMQGRLADLVGEAVTGSDPGPTGGRIRMVVVADDTDGVIVFAVAIDDDPPTPRYPCHQPQPVELITVL